MAKLNKSDLAAIRDKTRNTVRNLRDKMAKKGVQAAAGSIAAGAGLGWAEREGKELDPVGLGTPATVAIGLGVIGIFAKQPILVGAATGAATIATYNFVKDTDPSESAVMAGADDDDDDFDMSSEDDENE